MNRRISRKGFLKIAAATAMSGVTAGALAACQSGSTTTASSAAAGTYTPGTYTAEATGIGSTPVKVTMTFDAEKITDVQIDVSGETAGYGADIGDEMIEKILSAQSSEVDGHSGATITSNAIKKAAESCISQAKGIATEATTADTAETVVPDGMTTEEVESSIVELGDITPGTMTSWWWAPALPVSPQPAGPPSWGPAWPCCRSRAWWSARATAALPSSTPSPPPPARRCGST